jgi:uncharacterized membrane protein (TIGR02234 family)
VSSAVPEAGPGGRPTGVSPGRTDRSPGTTARREFALVLLLGAAGAGLVVLAERQAWARAVFVPPRPLPVQDIPVSGQQLVPLVGALALAALACLAAVIATRSVARRAAGILLAVLGAGTAAAAAGAVRASAVLAAARAEAADGVPGGSTTSGTSPAGTAHVTVLAGSAAHVVGVGVPWATVAVCGAVAIVLAGLAAAWRGPWWPVMSGRFQGGSGGMGPPRKASGGARGVVPPDDIWESLSRDIDPTADDPDVPEASAHATTATTHVHADAPRDLEEQLDGGTSA